MDVAYSVNLADQSMHASSLLMVGMLLSLSHSSHIMYLAVGIAHPELLTLLSHNTINSKCLYLVIRSYWSYSSSTIYGHFVP